MRNTGKAYGVLPIRAVVVSRYRASGRPPPDAVSAFNPLLSATVFLFIALLLHQWMASGKICFSPNENIADIRYKYVICGYRRIHANSKGKLFPAID
ncbi:unnamed protein product [Enterobius vermicularis]|uniref:Transposase n=1 Tax=Enterobius vermicularis TaxID=51028 RepID=A0A0N4V3E9_ENTVE|nr:unnamed protein product [Enterobius vermicularis]